jgi:hypothetical protein
MNHDVVYNQLGGVCYNRNETESEGPIVELRKSSSGLGLDNLHWWGKKPSVVARREAALNQYMSRCKQTQRCLEVPLLLRAKGLMVLEMC